MRDAIWVLNLFALIWCAVPLAILGWPVASLLLPFAISAIVAALAWRMPAGADGSAVDQVSAWKAVGLWGGVEAIAIAVVAIVLIRQRLPEAVMPAVAIIVGLHFLPLATSIRVPLYRVTGAALVLIGAVALLLPVAMRPAAIGFPAAAVLWWSCAVMIGRVRSAPDTAPR